MAFEPKISRARFTVRDYSPREMISISDSLRQTIFRRLDQALDVNDQPAPPLTDETRAERFSVSQKKYVTSKGRGYKTRKLQKTGRGVRDLNLTGETRRMIRTLRAGPNTAVLGPVQGSKQAWRLAAGKPSITYSQLLFIQNRRSLQWGVSRNDERALMQALNRLRSAVEVKVA